MTVLHVWFLSLSALSLLNSILGWRLCARWRRVRHNGAGGLPLNRSLLTAIENNQQTLGGDNGWFQRNPRRGWITLRLLVTGEHHVLNDALLTRRVYTLRLTTLLAFALFFAPFALPLLQPR